MAPRLLFRFVTAPAVASTTVRMTALTHLIRAARGVVPVWSKPAALRALRAAVVIPGLFALSSKVIGNPQVATFAAFGGFATLVLASFGGDRRDKLIAHFGLAVAGSVVIIIGTAVSSTTWLAAVVTVAVAFCVLFAGVASANAASGATATLLAYVLPAASPGTVSMIPDRLAGWWMASAVGTVAVELLYTRPPIDRLRASASRLALALAQRLDGAIDGTSTQADIDTLMAAKHELLSAYTEVPYRPTGLTVTDQAISALVEALQWSATSVVQAVSAPGRGRPQLEDRNRLAQSERVLHLTAELINDGRAEGIDEALRDLTSMLTPYQDLEDRSVTQDELHRAFHSRLVAAAARSVASNALIAARRAEPSELTDEPGGWWDQPVHPDPAVKRHTVARAIGRILTGHTSLRSIWFLNSARGAIALAAAVAIADVTNVQHGFWVVLGALSVLRTSASSTGASALRALAGTVAGFAVGAALLLAIGHHTTVLWAVLPLAILVAAYAPGTAPFAVGQAAFTVTITVLYNLIAPGGWKVGELRVEDVAIGVAVSAIVGICFWPRGATRVVAQDLADAFHSGGVYLVQSTAWALGVRADPPDAAATVLSTATRLDEALRGLLSEQGAKRVPKESLWRLAGAALRLRLVAHTLAGTVSSHREDDAGARTLMAESVRLSGEYDNLAGQLGHTPRTVAQELAGLHLGETKPDTHDARLIWIHLHLEHLAENLGEIAEPAASLAQRASSPWWH